MAGCIWGQRGCKCRGEPEEREKRQMPQLKADGRDIALEYILAVPAARYGDFAQDLERAKQRMTRWWRFGAGGRGTNPLRT